MTKQIEAFERFYGEYQKPLVPDALAKNADGKYKHYFTRDAIAIWHAALSQPNEPVGFAMKKNNGDYGVMWSKEIDFTNPQVALFTAPPNTSELEQANKVLEAKCDALKTELENTHNIALGAFAIKDANVAELTAKVEKMREALVFYSIRINGDIASKALEECK